MEIITKDIARTKFDFSKALLQNNFSQTQIRSFITLLNQELPPLKGLVKFNKEGISSSEVSKSELHTCEYGCSTASTDCKSFELHICVNDFSTFDKELKYQITCILCNHPRFLPCTSRNCLIDKCNPFHGGHSLSRRVPYKTIYYKNEQTQKEL